MATTFTAENATGDLILEQALAYARQLTRTAADAPDGAVTRPAEACVLQRGRDLLRPPLEIVLRPGPMRSKKRAPGRTGRCGTRRDNTGRADHPLVTALGTIGLDRTYFVCPQCRDSGRPRDDRIGPGDGLSPEALRLIVPAGGRWSFDPAGGHLEPFCGVTVSDELIRQRTRREGPTLAAAGASAPAVGAAFREALGDAEFGTDATKVSTVGGWRDARIGVLVTRVPGAATRAARDGRTLPVPSARFAFARIAGSEASAAQWVPVAEHLGIDPPSRSSARAGGADWIWDRTAEGFPDAQGVLDICHAPGACRTRRRAVSSTSPTPWRGRRRGVVSDCGVTVTRAWWTGSASRGRAPAVTGPRWAGCGTTWHATGIVGRMRCGCNGARRSGAVGSRGPRRTGSAAAGKRTRAVGAGERESHRRRLRCPRQRNSGRLLGIELARQSGTAPAIVATPVNPGRRARSFLPASRRPVGYGHQKC